MSLLFDGTSVNNIIINVFEVCFVCIHDSCIGTDENMAEGSYFQLFANAFSIVKCTFNLITEDFEITTRVLEAPVKRDEIFVFYLNFSHDSMVIVK